MSNANLITAKFEKADEFYTQLEDIERELKHYRAFFNGKIVYCNCDDSSSNFVRYFKEHFNELGLKKLLVSGYRITPSGVDKTTGDFRSAECIELLQQADIVVTNPPFSLFREFIAQLVKFEKKFVVIGNINCITYKEIFPLIKESKIWLGYGMGRAISGFVVPDDYELYGTETRINERGQKVVSTNQGLWLTNLPIKKRYEDLPLYKNYTPEKYPRYDNYDAIEVSKTAEIPCDYFGDMGVPITFLDKYNPAQFEIVEQLGNGKIGGRETYKRLIIRRVQSGLCVPS